MEGISQTQMQQFNNNMNNQNNNHSQPTMNNNNNNNFNPLLHQPPKYDIYGKLVRKILKIIFKIFLITK